MMVSNEEINILLNKAMKERYNDGELQGYRRGLCDFLHAIKTTKMTPEEIYKKLWH